MALYQIEHVSFQYPEASEAMLTDINITVEEGDFVLLCGPSGSGKTTLLRQLKREIRPEGHRQGEIRYRGILQDGLDTRHSIEEIGMVFQDPDSQIVMNTVWQELTFAMENLGYAAEQIQRRIGELVQFFGMQGWLQLGVHELSGGQKQLLNLASVMSLRPKVLLLDEPTAQLDPIAAKEFIQLLARINEELSITIIISEHRVEELFPLANQVVMLKAGEVAYAGAPQEVIRKIWSGRDEFFIPYLPAVCRLFLGAGGEDARITEEPIPLTVRAGRQWISQHTKALATQAESSAEASASTDRPLAAALTVPLNAERTAKQQAEQQAGRQGTPLLECRELFFTYEKNTPLVLKGCSLHIHQGEFFTLFGGNGSGKSTLLHQIAGARKPQRGNIFLEGKSLLRSSTAERSRLIGYVAQNPLLYFTRDTVGAQFKDRIERLEQGSGKGHQQGQTFPMSRQKRLDELLELFELKGSLDKHPLDLSGGQQQKAALILVLLAEPRLLLLDEPTKGLDPTSKMKLAAQLDAIRGKGTTILMVSHDIEFAASYATRCGLLFDGKLVAIDETRNFLRDNYFYTTIIHRTAGDFFPAAITMKDIGMPWEK
ncbi:ABC transporter ATP-binding protein [Paenibacillus woosongensis]|uniref:ATP-binding cassette domain-containing protein n=1 Tax=Paenibacillus woosongensis TaxID=307580 RepID=A0A7X2Z3H4_9BACL|nr:ATP-binding cassette domain-containing protein [Paenibacillus woosongensis]MUG46921.1 ATP-binding cassette domain-containing protein [Paenibacillus woosongensis]